MITYVIRKTLIAIPTLIIILTIIFVGMRLVPGGPAISILGDRATQESIAVLEKKMGLDQPLWKQYTTYFAGLLRGDMGKSIVTNQPVSREILRALPYTLDLAIGGTLIALIIALPVGIVSALKQNSRFDDFSRFFAFIGIVIPNFLLGIALLMVLSLYWDLFPIMGGGNLANPLDRLYHLFLPALTLGLARAALTTRVTRSAILDVKNHKYIVTARAKGLSERVVFFKHALRNALIPVVTIIGLDIARSFGGAVIIEIVYTRPGIGALLVTAIRQHDYPLIQGGILVFAFIVMFVNTLVDIVYALIDPRVQYA